MSETHEAMGLPDTTKLDDVSGDTTPMEEHLSTSDKEHIRLQISALNE